MEKKFWFFLCVFQSIIILSAIFLVIWPSLTISEPQSVDLTDYLSHFSEENNFLPDSGYIPNVETAKTVGSSIIDKLTGKSFFGIATVKYDENNRLWMIEKSYLFGGGGFVIIDQDTGKVIKALLTK